VTESRVEFASAAAERFDRLRRHERGRLLQLLNRSEGCQLDPGLVTIGTRQQIAACEVVVSSEGQVILVYAVISADAAWKLLTGKELDREFRDRRMRRADRSRRSARALRENT
jgi:hypothetical protein